MKRTISIIAAICILTLLGALAVPTCAAGVTTSGGCISHTVVPGDTIWWISINYGADFQKVINANTHIKDPHWIYPGDIIYIPVNSGNSNGSSGTPNTNNNGGEAVSDNEREVVRLCNEIRRKNGLSELTLDAELSSVARLKSQDMHDKKYFSHTSPTYGTPFEMIRAFGISYRTAGENIAQGYSTPQAVVDGWMNSEGHRANILNGSFTRIGVGYVSSGNYWTQMFIG